MQIRILAATSAVALLASSGATLAQETMSDGLVMVNVAGSMVEVPVSLAAEACGMDAAAVIEAAGMMNTDAKGADMVAADPGADAASMPEGEETAEDALASDDAAAPSEAAVGAGAAATETDTGTVAATDDMAASDDMAADATGADAMATGDMAADAAASDDMAAGSDMAADAGTEADMSADSATADAAAATLDGADPMMMAVCEIDQATADQYGLPAASDTAGG